MNKARTKPKKEAETRQMHPYAEAVMLLAEALQLAWEFGDQDIIKLVLDKLHYFTRNDHFAAWNDPIDVLVDTMRSNIRQVSEGILLKACPPREWLESVDELTNRPYQMTI